VALASRHSFDVVWRAAEAEKAPTFADVEITAVGGRLGVAAETATEEEIARASLKEGVPVRVAAVFTGGLAEKLLQPGDLLLSWNGFPFGGDDPLARWRSFVVAARDGDKVVLRYLRGKERRAASVQF
jgi:S1-C subfamily serine protease